MTDDEPGKFGGDYYSEMEALLLQARRSHEAEIERIGQTLAFIRSAKGKSTGAPVAMKAVLPGQYRGMGMSPALESYLKERPGQRIPFEKVLEDLQVGEAELGAPKWQARSLKVTMANRKSLVQYDPATWAMWLAPTANLPPKKRVRRRS